MNKNKTTYLNKYKSEKNTKCYENYYCQYVKLREEGKKVIEV